MNNINKKFIYYFLLVVIIGVLPKTVQVIRSTFTNDNAKQACTLEAKVCPDGSSVVRTMPNCEFALCPASLPSGTTTLSMEVSTTTPLATTTEVNSENIPSPTGKSAPVITKQETATTKSTSVVSKIKAAVASVVTTIAEPFKPGPPPQGNANDANIPASTYITKVELTQSGAPVPAPVSLPPEDFAGQKYVVKGNDVLSNDNKVIYTIPPEVIAAVSSPNAGWTNTTINVVPVGTAAPILNAIPIKDLPGKYYLSENSFGNIESCEFSNKIFILDTNTNTVTLMYEENSSTLSADDPRACNSEIFLLATEGNKLVIKYHTIGTNTLCDSAWSEPDKTFYLDVTKLSTQGMTRYAIPENLSATAEQEEEACRAKL